MSVTITSCAYALPEGRLTHDELKQRFGADLMDRLIENTGIFERRVCAKNETGSDLAVRAVKKIFDETDTDPESIDLIIMATQTPDYLMPTTACLLQERLGLSTKAASFDINLGCSQFVYAHSVAYSMIRSGLATKALVMTSDTPSRVVNPHDRAVVPLFGDAATAAILETSDSGDGFLDFGFGTDGSGAESLIWPTSGLRKPRSEKTSEVLKDAFGNLRAEDDMFMDGKAIFIFTLKTVPKSLGAFLEKKNLGIDDVDFFVFHQASEMIVESVAKKMKIPEEKFNRIYKMRGNSGGSTVGISLVNAINDGKISAGDLIVMSAFGVGLSWANALYKVPQVLPACFAVE